MYTYYTETFKGVINGTTSKWLIIVKKIQAVTIPDEQDLSTNQSTRPTHQPIKN